MDSTLKVALYNILFSADVYAQTVSRTPSKLIERKRKIKRLKNILVTDISYNDYMNEVQKISGDKMVKYPLRHHILNRSKMAYLEYKQTL